jgi:hypothetical protein
MKKFLLPVVIALACWLMPLVSSSQVYSAFGMAVNNNNNLFDTISAPGDSLLFNFPATPATAWGNATIVVYYQGNFGNSGEYLDLFDENGNYGGSTNISVFDCGPEDSTVLNFPAPPTIGVWNANGSIDLLLIPNSGISLCGTSRVRVKLTYTYCINPAGPAQFASLSIPDSSVCALDGVYSLTGYPSGGTFSGPGVSGSSFNPVNLGQGTYSLNYTGTDSTGCSTTGSLSVFVGSRPIVNNGNTAYACYGTSVTLNAAMGNGFTWFADAGLTNSLDTTNMFVTPNLTSTTTYYVAGTDNSESFSADTLLATDSLIVDENNLAGDDRGGMAITHTHVYLNGDDNCVRYDLDLNPASGISLPIRDGIVSDLRSAKIWTLWNTSMSSDPQNAPGQFTVDALRELDSNLAVTNNMISLSQSIDMGTDNQQNGIFAGFGYVGLYSGNTQHWYVIDMDNGNVTDLGYESNPGFYGSENWSDWGVLEANCTGGFSAIYRSNGSTSRYSNSNQMGGPSPADIQRLVLPNGAVTIVGTFPNGISDMASLIFSPWNNRWYWHYEGSSTTFGGSSETLGYADASFAQGSCGGSGLGCPSMVTVNVPADVTFNFPSSNVCLNDGAQLLTQGAPAGGVYSGIGVGTNSSGTVFFPALAGNGTYTLTYTVTDSASGCVDFATDAVTVNACTGVEEQTLANGISVYPNPNNGSFTVAVNASAENMLIEITDLQGRVIFSSQENNVTPGFSKQIELGNAATGMYLMKVSSGKDQQIQKITVQK